MILCRACGHQRLLHDSWGCKDCNCRVSIVYLTFDSPAQKDEKAERETLRLGNVLDGRASRLAEFRLKVLFERAVAESMEGGAQWWAAGLENRAVGNGEGSTPSPSSEEPPIE